MLKIVYIVKHLVNLSSGQAYEKAGGGNHMETGKQKLEMGVERYNENKMYTY